MSESRRTLAKLLNEKRIIEGRSRLIDQQLNKVLQADKALRAVQVRLDALDAKEASTMEAWTGAGAAPAPDIESRAVIESDLRVAQEAADMARHAAAPAFAENKRIAERLAKISHEIEVAKGLVVLDEVVPIVDEFERAAGELDARWAAVRQALRFIVAKAHDLGNLGSTTPDIAAAQPILAGLEKLNERVFKTRDRPLAGELDPRVDDPLVADRLSSFVAALSSDPAAQF